MERNFYNDDFEEFLKLKADQNKMYPSDRVWNNVYGSLHNRRRWFAIGLVLLLVSSAFMISREVLHTGETPVAQKSTPQKLITPAADSSTGVYAIGIPAYKGATPQTGHTPHTIAVDNNTTILSDAGSPAQDMDIAALTGTAGSANSSTISYNTLADGRQEMANDALAGNTPTAAGADIATKNTKVQPVPAFEPFIAVDRKLSFPQSQSATITVKPAARNRWSMKLFSSPIISYRRLSDLSKTAKYVPVAISYSGNIDSYVHHKPAMGFELGTRIQYRLNPLLSVFSGVQMNYSRYYIDAYKYSPERAIIALTSTTPDTLSNFTSIRNFNGNAPEQLQNQYLQVSIPIGAELKLLGNDKIQLGVAASVQPAYVLASSTYLISSDFKNYVQNNDLVRRFNVHTSFEAFISYQAPSGLRWQLGPQFRYQLMSSYSNQYPIREYITEFGIKLGITRIFK